MSIQGGVGRQAPTAHGPRTPRLSLRQTAAACCYSRSDLEALRPAGPSDPEVRPRDLAAGRPVKPRGKTSGPCGRPARQTPRYDLGALWPAGPEGTQWAEPREVQGHRSTGAQGPPQDSSLPPIGYHGISAMGGRNPPPNGGSKSPTSKRPETPTGMQANLLGAQAPRGPGARSSLARPVRSHRSL